MSGDLRERLTEALTREHYRRARERTEASPEEHSAAMADVALSVLAAHGVGEPRTQIAQTAVLRPGDTLILRVTDRTPMDYVERFRESLREKLPDVEALILGGVEEMAIYRPEVGE